MPLTLPQLDEPLNGQHKQFLAAFAKSCRHSSIAMLKQSQSGHPGGSLSAMDYLALLYTMIISQTGERVVVSNGHISPGVYSVLAELGYIPKQAVIDGFRQAGSPYEGHITRHVPGVEYGTGPLGIGTSVATSFALSDKLSHQRSRTFLLLGDGEYQEGQIHEMTHFAAKYKLDNLIAFVDYNQVQLSDSLKTIMPVNIHGEMEAAGWEVIEADAHDYDALWKALRDGSKSQGKPVLILGNSIMGQGVSYMEEEGKAHRATWHGNAPKPEQADSALAELALSEDERTLIADFVANNIRWQPEKTTFFQPLKVDDRIDPGAPTLYEAGTVTDCRSAYGKALLDLAERNPQVVALSADLSGSTKTSVVEAKLPDQHIECGIAEQHMVSLAGGLSLSGYVPFASTFGAFMTSRAKDQARVNDINQTNVKMVATHCGLSVGEDGPTHQAIDDMGSFLGLLTTHIIEPADANHTDRIIRYIASHEGNFYVRMGRHKFPVILKEDGTVFYDEKYQYVYGRTDLLRSGQDLTIVATGPMIGEALAARESLGQSHPDKTVEIIATSSIKQFDQTLRDSVVKTGHVLTVEDHNPYSGLSSQLARYLQTENIATNSFRSLGVEAYQLSGTPDELYASAGIDKNAIAQAAGEMLSR